VGETAWFWGVTRSSRGETKCQTGVKAFLTGERVINKRTRAVKAPGLFS
jgi:hypothetical protein